MKQSNATAVNEPLLDDAIKTEHSEKVLSMTKTQNAGGTDGQSIC